MLLVCGTPASFRPAAWTDQATTITPALGAGVKNPRNHPAIIEKKSQKEKKIFYKNYKTSDFIGFPNNIFHRKAMIACRASSLQKLLIGLRPRHL